jgi:hypothetical protein
VGLGYCAADLIRVNEFKFIQIRPNPTRSKQELPYLKKNMVLKGLKRGTTFSLESSSDSKWISNEKLENL